MNVQVTELAGRNEVFMEEILTLTFNMQLLSLNSALSVYGHVLILPAKVYLPNF